MIIFPINWTSVKPTMNTISRNPSHLSYPKNFFKKNQDRPFIFSYSPHHTSKQAKIKSRI